MTRAALYGLVSGSLEYYFGEMANSKYEQFHTEEALGIYTLLDQAHPESGNALQNWIKDTLDHDSERNKLIERKVKWILSAKPELAQDYRQDQLKIRKLFKRELLIERALQSPWDKKHFALQPYPGYVHTSGFCPVADDLELMMSNIATQKMDSVENHRML